MEAKPETVEGKKAIEETEIAQTSAFDALEKDFRKVLNELVNDQSLDRFRKEYQKLHGALKRSHENQLKLTAKCRELNAEIVANAQKVGTAMRLSSEDQNSIALLRKEIDKAWKMVDTAHEKEKRAKRTIQQLRAEIQNLSRLVDQGAGLSIGQENTVNELLRIKEDLGKEVETQASKINKMNKEINDLHDTLHETKVNADKKEALLTTVKEKLKKGNNDAARHARRADKTQAALLVVKKACDEQSQLMKKKLQEIEENNELIKQKSAETVGLKKENKRVNLILDEERSQKEQHLVDIENLKQELAELSAQNQKAHATIQLSQEEQKKIKEQLAYAQRVKERLNTEKGAVLKQREEVEIQRDTLKTTVSQLQAEINQMKKSTHTDHKIIKELQITMKRTASSLQVAKRRNESMDTKIIELEAKCKELTNDIIAQTRSIADLVKENHKLEKEKEKTLALAGERLYQKRELAKELQQANVEKEDISTRVLEEKNKLKVQQSIYESVRSERNLFCQQNMESQDEIAEMKRKFKIMQHQIDQFKEEMQNKDKALIKQHFVIKKSNEEAKTLDKQKTKKDEMLAQADQLLASQDVEIKTLRRTLQDAEQASRTQKQVFDSVVDERDILGAQLIRRNDELALLYDKIRILETTLEKGEVQYKERVEDIKAIKLQIKDQKRQLMIRNNQVANMEALKNEVYHLQRELLQERTKVKALSEELENPINVHRWRKLAGSDPNAFEMVQKIKTLQKRLIEKTEEAVEKDLLIQEKEKLYIELKNILARQPGPEVAEQLSAYQQTLKERTRQMKATAAELNLFQSRVNEYKYEMERLTRELADVKRKYYEQKKRENLVREAQRGPITPAESVQENMEARAGTLSATQKYVGGGYQIG